MNTSDSSGSSIKKYNNLKSYDLEPLAPKSSNSSSDSEMKLKGLWKLPTDENYSSTESFYVAEKITKFQNNFLKVNIYIYNHNI